MLHKYTHTHIPVTAMREYRVELSRELCWAGHTHELLNGGQQLQEFPAKKWTKWPSSQQLSTAQSGKRVKCD